jgi:hypothetical protein
MGVHVGVQDDTIDIHIRAACRPGVETQRMLRELVAWCWPGGTADQSDPIARGWLRQFASIKPIVVAPECTCAVRRCAACN